LWLGPRRGETIALDWSAYEESAQVVSVHCAVIQTCKGVRRKETKTGLIREIPVPPKVARALTRQHALQSADELAAPHGAYRNIDAIFTDELGRRYTPMAATNAFQRLARKAKLSTTRLHDLRHHAASELLAAGVDPALVAAIMGHSIETLLRNYAHVRPDAQREKRAAIEKLSARLEAAGGGGV
jgi:integrase